MPRSRWQWSLIELLAGAGLADSLYLTVIHYSGGPLACANTGVVNCDLVTRSSFGVVPGTSLPVSLGGVAWFCVVLLLALAWQRGPDRRIAALLVGWSGAGALIVLYLVYVELVRLHHVCEWCTVVHVATIAILLLALAILQDTFIEATDA